MKPNTKGLRQLLNVIKIRVPEREPIESIIGCIYDYCLNNDLILGDRSDDVNYAGEIKVRVPADIIYDIEEILNNLSMEEIKELVYEIVSNSGLSCETTDRNMNDLIYKLLELNGGGDILFDLGTGFGGFLAGAYLDAVKNNYIFKSLSGIDVNVGRVYIANMVMEIMRTNQNREGYQSRVEYSNILVDEYNSPYTKAFVYPPLGMKFSGYSEKIISAFPEVMITSRNSVEWIFINEIIRKMVANYTHRAVALVSGNALFNAHDKDYRNAVISHNFLEGIVELPKGALPNVGAYLYLLILSRNNKSVKIINGTDYIIGNTKYATSVMDNERIIIEYFNKNAPSRTAQEMLENNNWTPSVVLIDVKNIKDGVKLNEVANVFSGSQYTSKYFESNFDTEPTGYKILTSSDIQNGSVVCRNLQNIKLTDSKLSKYFAQPNDLIITSKSSKVKTVVIEENYGGDIIITGGMIIVRPDTTRLNPYFLKMFLDSDDGIKLLKSIQKGNIIVTIGITEFGEVKIPLPDIKVQNAYALKYKKKLMSLNSLKREVELLEQELKNLLLIEDLGDN